MLVFSVDKPLRVRWSASLLGDTKYPIVCLSPLPRISVGSRSEVCIYHMRCCPHTQRWIVGLDLSWRWSFLMIMVS
jgi:hypothetical protein